MKYLPLQMLNMKKSKKQQMEIMKLRKKGNMKILKRRMMENTKMWKQIPTEAVCTIMVAILLPRQA